MVSDLPALLRSSDRDRTALLAGKTGRDTHCTPFKSGENQCFATSFSNQHKEHQEILQISKTNLGPTFEEA